MIMTDTAGGGEGDNQPKSTERSIEAAQSPDVNSLLSPELLLKILELGTESLVWQSNLRYPYLRACSLVCRSWSEPARALLWRSIAVWNDASVDLLLKSSGHRKYRTRSVWLSATCDGEYELSWAQARRLLRELRGPIREVEFEGFEDADSCPDWEVFTDQNLSELRYLSLRDNDFTTDNLSTRYQSSFTLHRLALRFNEYNDIQNPYTFFESHNLTHLEVLADGDISADQLIDLCSLFKFVSGNLQVFKFNERPPPEMVSSFAFCKSLKTLSLCCGEEQILNIAKILPAPTLVSLSVQHGRQYTQLSSVIREVVQIPSMGNLKYLETGLGEDSLVVDEVKELLNGRGIEWERFGH